MRLRHYLSQQLDGVQLAQRTVVRRADRQISYQSDDRFDQRPRALRVRLNQPNQRRQPMMQPNLILRHIGVRMPGRHVPQGADRRLRNFFATAGFVDRAQQRFDAPMPAQIRFIPLVVAGQIRQNPSATRDHLWIGRVQQANHALQQTLDVFFTRRRIRQVPQRPQAVPLDSR